MLQNISTGYNNNNNNNNNNIPYAHNFEQILCSEVLRGITTQEVSRIQRIEHVILLHCSCISYLPIYLTVDCS